MASHYIPTWSTHSVTLLTPSLTLFPQLTIQRLTPAVPQKYSACSHLTPWGCLCLRLQLSKPLPPWSSLSLWSNITSLWPLSLPPAYSRYSFPPLYFFFFHSTYHLLAFCIIYFLCLLFIFPCCFSHWSNCLKEWTAYDRCLIFTMWKPHKIVLVTNLDNACESLSSTQTYRSSQ